MADAVPPPPRTQRRLYDEAVAASNALPQADTHTHTHSYMPNPGDVFYVLAKDWFDKWDAYTTVLEGAEVSEAPEPGPIDNSSIADANHAGALNRGLSDNVEYTLLPERAYKLLRSWYGAQGVEFPRRAIELADGSGRVEVYPQFCTIASTARPDAAPAAVMISREATATVALNTIWGDERLSRALGLPSRSAIRLWARRVQVQSPTEDGDPAAATGADEADAAWEPFANATRMQTIARDDIQVDLLVEVRRDDGSWARGLWFGRGWEPLATENAAPSAEELVEWRSSLAVGSRLDAFDGSDWIQSSVVKVSPDAGGVSESDKLTVHFTGWSAQWDKTFERSAEQLQPLYTKTPMWRQALRPGEFLEYGLEQASLADGKPGDRLWFPAFIRGIDHGHAPAIMTLSIFRAGRWEPLDRQVSLGNEDEIAPKLTHDKNAQKWAGHGRPTGEGIPQAPVVSAFTAAPRAANAQAQAAAGTTNAAATPSSGSGAGGILSSVTRRVRSWMGAGGDDEDEGEALVAASPADQRSVATRYRAYYFEGHSSGGWGTHTRRPSPPGVCGLDNLGNTCFMNSMLQCLSNVKELTEYMLGDDYLGDINLHNPLGSKGAMAHAYAALMQAMWAGQFSRVAPAPVKAIVAKRAPQFVGYGQQDSQEFMSFLLDLLLEDVCRVHPKPSVPTIESGTRPEPEVADEAWTGWQSRNSSRVADVFAGQFRSHVQCNICGRNSVTFDAFTSLSVPIPVEKWVTLTVFYFGAFNSRPEKLAFHFRQTEVPTGAQIARMLVDQLIEEQRSAPAEEAPASGVPAGRNAPGRVPESPDEIMFGWITSSPCMLRQVVPHYGNHISAASHFKRNLRSVRDLVLFAYRIPHAGGPPEAIPVSDEGAATPAAPAPTSHPSLAEFPFDYEEVAQDDDDDDYYGTYSYSYTQQPKRKPKVERPPPVGPTGPRPAEFVPVWCRFQSARGFEPAADGLVVPLTSDADFRPLAQPITNKQFLNNVWACMRRLVLTKHDSIPPFEDWPFTVGYFAYIYEKRHLLGTDYGRTTVTDAIPYDDEPFVWQKDRQYVLDMRSDQHKEHFDSKEGGSSYEHPSFRSGGPARRSITLEDCFQRFSVREQLGENDKWYCSACKDHVRAFKKMDLWRLPPVLIVHLKRFQYERSYFSSVIRGKIDDHVDFPTRNLDLRPHLLGPVADDQPPVYDLFAVSEHSGGLGGGHYTAHGLNWRDSKWYNYNDGHVGPAREGDCVRPSAYVLFYRLRKPGGVPAVPLPPAEPSRALGANPNNMDDMDD